MAKGMYWRKTTAPYLEKYSGTFICVVNNRIENEARPNAVFLCIISEKVFQFTDDFVGNQTSIDLSPIDDALAVCARLKLNIFADYQRRYSISIARK